MMQEYIQTNFAFVIAITFLLLFLYTHRTFDKKISNMFMLAVGFTLILFVVENLYTWSSELPHPTTVRYVAAALGYSIRPVIILMLILVVYRRKTKHKIFLCVPAILNVLVAFSGLFSDISYSFTQDNEFKRGPLGYTPHITALCYMIILLIATFQFFREKSYYEGILIVIIEASNAVATVLESVYGYKGLLRTSIVLSLAFYYIFFQTQSTKRDALTGALRRQYLFLDVEHLSDRLHALISLDLNNLKTINDTQGHAAGDEAILSFVNCVNKTMFYGCTLYRTGGDEFVILCSKCTESQVHDFVKQFKLKMAQTPYSCAVGVTFFKNGDDFEEVCSKADAAMYGDKARMKK